GRWKCLARREAGAAFGRVAGCAAGCLADRSETTRRCEHGISIRELENRALGFRKIRKGAFHEKDCSGRVAGSSRARGSTLVDARESWSRGQAGANGEDNYASARACGLHGIRGR